MDHAGRFQALCDAINRIPNNDWVNTALYKQCSAEGHDVSTPRGFLGLWITNTVRKNGNTYIMTPLHHTQKEKRAAGTHRVFTGLFGEYRRELPKEFVRLLDMELPSRKVNPCWITCYVHGVLPNQSAPGWQNFECSHRCIQHDVNLYNKKKNRAGDEACNDHQCLVWESKSVNQSRGNTFCTNACHCPCGATVCKANSIHVPCCI